MICEICGLVCEGEEIGGIGDIPVLLVCDCCAELFKHGDHDGLMDRMEAKYGCL